MTHENFTLWLSLALNTCTANVVTRHYILFNKEEIEKKKKRFSAILSKSKSVVFSFLFSIYMYLPKIFILNMKHGIMKISLCYNKSLCFTNPQTCLSKCV